MESTTLKLPEEKGAVPELVQVLNKLNTGQRHTLTDTAGPADGKLHRTRDMGHVTLGKGGVELTQ